MAWSETSTTRSVFITLWMSGMCLSPIPWMLCSPKPFLSIVGHSRASTATIFVPWRSLSQSPAPIVPAEPVAEMNAAGRSPGCSSARASTTRSRARPVTAQWTRWFPYSLNWLRMTLAASFASSAQAS